MEINTKKSLYIFFDEGGDFNFSATGTKYYSFTSLSSVRPCSSHDALAELKYDAIETGLQQEYFHATEDRQWVRDRVFDIIRQRLGNIRVDSLIVEKCKANPSIRPEEKFYPMMLETLFQYVFKGHSLDNYQRVVIITDSIPVENKRRSIEKAIKTFIARSLGGKIEYQLLHHPSKSNFDLQMVDYLNWAIFKKWERKDTRSYDIIKSAIKSEFDIFCSGTSRFY